MADRIWVKILGGVLVVLYPVLVYFGLQNFDPRWVALALLGLIGIRLLSKQVPLHMRLAMAFAILIAATPSLMVNQEFSLLLYPVLMNAVLLILFASSVLYPPSVIERLARLQEPNLPPSGVAYTRKVTLVWCVFFVFNGTVAAWTIGMGKDIWALYNGLISYLLMASLFGAEWLVRRRVKEQHLA